VCRRLFILSLLIAVTLTAHAQNESPGTQNTGDTAKKQTDNFVDHVFNLFNMAGTEKSKQFRAMTQSERNSLYFKSMVNPLSFVRVAASAGIDQAKDKPVEWEQGASGYGKRYANIFGQYSIQRTVTYGLGSALHEDNRYFSSGKQGFWPRTGYALSSGILARHDDATLHFSFSQVGGVAAGAFLARTWLPASQNSMGDGAVSFGISMGSNVGFGVVKEFLPDIFRSLAKKHKKLPTGLDDVEQHGSATQP
jgi:hypothetical protein